MKTRALVCLISLLSLTCNVYAQQFEPEKHKLIQTDREDGRYVSSRGFVHAFLKNMTPEYAFDENFTKEEMLVWQTKMQDSMKELMKHPALQNLPVPQMVDEVQRDGYRVQKWEAYPLPECVVPYLVLIPDTIAANEKVSLRSRLLANPNCMQHTVRRLPKKDLSWHCHLFVSV